MDYVEASKYSDAGELFRIPFDNEITTGTQRVIKVLAASNACFCHFRLLENRALIKKATEALVLISQLDEEVESLVGKCQEARLLLLRGCGHARLKSGRGDDSAAEDWARAGRLFTEDQHVRLCGDFIVSAILKRMRPFVEKRQVSRALSVAEAYFSGGSDNKGEGEDVGDKIVELSIGGDGPDVSASDNIEGDKHLALPTPPSLPVPPSPSQPAPISPSQPAQSSSSKKKKMSSKHVSKLDYSSLNPAMLDIAVHNLNHPHENAMINRAIALGNSQVNSRRFAEAEKTFRAVLNDDAKSFAAYLGIGSAKAMQGDLIAANKDFTLAVKHGPAISECWKRRGQTMQALGRRAEAISDVRKAIKLMEEGRKHPKENRQRIKGKAVTDPDAYNQLGNMLYQSKFYRAALDEGFLRCLQAFGNPTSDESGELGTLIGGGGVSGIYNMVGLCNTSLGDYEEGKKAFATCLSIEANFKEAWVNLGQLHRDYGNTADAIQSFAKAFALDSSYVHAYHLSGLCFYSMGNYAMAISAFLGGLNGAQQQQKAGNADPKAQNVPALFHMLGVSFQALGLYPRAMEYFKQVPRSIPSGVILEGAVVVAKHSSWYNRELAFFLWTKLDQPINSWELDDEVSEIIKEGWSKRKDYKDIQVHSNALKYMQVTKSIPAVDLSKALLGKEWLSTAARLGRFIQLKSQGFVANERQHRQFGFAVMEAAQFMKERKVKCGWRESMNVLVKWRQISEPNDPVWWIDKLTKASLKEGFGLQTPLVTGELRVIRYYPYFNKAFAMLKKLMVTQCKLGDKVGEVVKRSKTLDELYNLVEDDFWVIVPCFSEVTGENMEGTRLTLQKYYEGMRAQNVSETDKVGFEFTIRTPSTPHRFKQFNEQFKKIWNDLQEVFERGGEKGGGAFKTDMLRLALKFFYYWVCFGPLTRGSAAVGYAGMVAIVRLGGFEIIGGMQEKVQLDWEAILSVRAEAFIDEQVGWLEANTIEHGEDDDSEDEEDVANRISNALPTLRARIEALNAQPNGQPNRLAQSLGR